MVIWRKWKKRWTSSEKYVYICLTTINKYHDYKMEEISEERKKLGKIGYFSFGASVARVMWGNLRKGRKSAEE